MTTVPRVLKYKSWKVWMEAVQTDQADTRGRARPFGMPGSTKSRKSSNGRKVPGSLQGHQIVKVSGWTRGLAPSVLKENAEERKRLVMIPGLYTPSFPSLKRSPSSSFMSLDPSRSPPSLRWLHLHFPRERPGLLPSEIKGAPKMHQEGAPYPSLPPHLP